MGSTPPKLSFIALQAGRHQGPAFGHAYEATLAVNATCMIAVRFTAAATWPSIPALLVTGEYNTDFGPLTQRFGGAARSR